MKRVKDEFKISSLEPEQREYKTCKWVWGLNTGPRNNETGIKKDRLKVMVAYPDDQVQWWGEYKVLIVKGEDLKVENISIEVF